MNTLFYTDAHSAFKLIKRVVVGGLIVLLIGFTSLPVEAEMSRQAKQAGALTAAFHSTYTGGAVIFYKGTNDGLDIFNPENWGQAIFNVPQTNAPPGTSDDVSGGNRYPLRIYAIEANYCVEDLHGTWLHVGLSSKEDAQALNFQIVLDPDLNNGEVVLDQDGNAVGGVNLVTKVSPVRPSPPQFSDLLKELFERNIEIQLGLPEGSFDLGFDLPIFYETSVGTPVIDPDLLEVGEHTIYQEIYFLDPNNNKIPLFPPETFNFTMEVCGN